MQWLKSVSYPQTFSSRSVQHHFQGKQSLFNSLSYESEQYLEQSVFSYAVYICSIRFNHILFSQAEINELILYTALWQGCLYHIQPGWEGRDPSLWGSQWWGVSNPPLAQCVVTETSLAYVWTKVLILWNSLTLCSSIKPKYVLPEPFYSWQLTHPTIMGP